MNISPILRLRGTVRLSADRTVPALEARPAEYDQTGNLVRAAREHRPAYTVHDVTVDTNPGGLVQFVITQEADSQAGTPRFTLGDTVDLPVRAFVQWKGNAPRRFPVVGYSLAGDVYAAEKATDTGRRAAVAAV